MEFLLLLLAIISLGGLMEIRFRQLKRVRDKQFRTLLKALGREDLIEADATETDKVTLWQVR